MVQAPRCDAPGHASAQRRSLHPCTPSSAGSRVRCNSLGTDAWQMRLIILNEMQAHQTAGNRQPAGRWTVLQAGPVARMRAERAPSSASSHSSLAASRGLEASASLQSSQSASRDAASNWALARTTINAAYRSVPQPPHMQFAIAVGGRKPCSRAWSPHQCYWEHLPYQARMFAD